MSIGGGVLFASSYVIVALITTVGDDGLVMMPMDVLRDKIRVKAITDSFVTICLYGTISTFVFVIILWLGVTY